MLFSIILLASLYCLVAQYAVFNSHKTLTFLEYLLIGFFAPIIFPIKLIVLGWINMTKDNEKN